MKKPRISIDSSFKTLSFDFSTIKALLTATNRYRTLFENAGDAIFVLNLKGKMLDANRIACERLGYTRRELLELNLEDIEPPEENESIENRMEKLRREGHLIFETVHERKDGKTIPIEVSSRIIEYENETAVLTIARDISERKEAEEEKARLQSQLRQAQKMEAIGTLAGGIAHDFNNILTPISGYTELAMRELPAEDKARKNLEQVLVGVQRAKSLVRQILTFGRQDSQERYPLQVKSIIKEALKLLRASLPATIEFKTDMSSESMITADPTQIHQVIINLCTNAQHAMKEFGGILEIVLEDVELSRKDSKAAADLKPGSYVCLAVSDTGCGMEKELLDRIFEPYYTTKPEGEGTGMGLSVVHGIVKNHGGDIVVETEKGKGTSFKVFFPKLEAEEGKRETIARFAHIPRGRERILLVDDEKAVTDVMEQIFAELGYRITCRDTPLAALETFRSRPFSYDLIVSDMIMPKMTGLQMAREMLRVRSNIPVIIVTGNRREISAEKATRAGVRALLVKPLSIEELARTVREVLENNKKNPGGFSRTK